MLKPSVFVTWASQVVRIPIGYPVGTDIGAVRCVVRLRNPASAVRCGQAGPRGPLSALAAVRAVCPCERLPGRSQGAPALKRGHCALWVAIRLSSALRVDQAASWRLLAALPALWRRSCPSGVPWTCWRASGAIPGGLPLPRGAATLWRAVVSPWDGMDCGECKQVHLCQRECERPVSTSVQQTWENVLTTQVHREQLTSQQPTPCPLPSGAIRRRVGGCIRAAVVVWELSRARPDQR